MAKSKSTDAIFLTLQRQIEEKKKELETISKPVYKTKQVFNLNGTTFNFNVLTEKQLVSFYGKVLKEQEAFLVAAQELDSKESFDLEGCSVEDIFHDIQLKIKIKNKVEKEKQLNNLIQLVEEEYSEEIKKQKKIDMITKKLEEL